MESTSTVETTEPLLIVISGTSGAGKDSVIKLLAKRNHPFHFVITTTSRKPRKDEVNGVDYYFLSEEEFKIGIDNGDYLEHAIVYDQYKGVAKKQVQEALASGKDVVMRLNVEGAATIKQISKDAILVFITTEDQDNLLARLVSRKTDSIEQQEKRIRIAKEELDQIGLFTYKIINRENQLDKAVDQLVSIIEVEHLKVAQRRISL